MPKFPCDIVSLDAQDVMGTHHINVAGDLVKRRLSKDGKFMEELKHVTEKLVPN
jgi:hypothetical protein